MAKSKSRQQPRPAAPSPKTASPVRPVAPAIPPPDWNAMADRYALPILYGLLALAFLLRVMNLDALSLWIDEFVHVQRAKDFLEGKGPLLTDDNNGILLTVVLLPFFKILGPTAWAARFPSVLFGVGTVWLLYRLGERLFNRYVGLLAAFGGACSLYLVFWSHIARNYSIFVFFYLLLCWVFLKFFEAKTDNTSANFFEKNGLSRRYMIWLPLVLIAALMSHQLTIFFAFAVGVYAIFSAVSKIIQGDQDRFSNKYFWLGAVALPVMLVMLIPGLHWLLRVPLSALLSAQQIDWILPNTKRVAELWKTVPWQSFHVYNGVVRYEMTYLYYAGLAGLVAAFWLNRRSALWLVCGFVVPLLLMSFVFREPALPRYFIAVYPWLLLAAAAFFAWLWQYLNKTFFSNATHNTRYALLALPLVLWVGSIRWPEIKKLVLAEQLEGHVVDRNISSFNFTNWKQPCDYVNAKRQPGDVLMSTVTTAASYYLKEKNVLWFRQFYFDTQKKNYQPNPPNPAGGNSAASLEDLQRTVENNPRGWLLADYYMDNIFVDDGARTYVFQNMHFYPEASQDGSVMLFGWDHSRPKPQQQNLVLQLGRASDKIISRENIMYFPPEVATTPNGIEMLVRTSGVDTDLEAMVMFNQQNVVYLPPNKTRGAIEMQRIPIPKGSLRPGRNSILVVYDEERIKRDPDKGFTLYYLGFNPK